MKKNMSNLDRTLRSFIAAVIAVLYFTGFISGTFAIAMLVIAVYFLLTSLISVCPFYLTFGLSTTKKRNEDR